LCPSTERRRARPPGRRTFQDRTVPTQGTPLGGKTCACQLRQLWHEQQPHEQTPGQNPPSATAVQHPSSTLAVPTRATARRRWTVIRPHCDESNDAEHVKPVAPHGHVAPLPRTDRSRVCHPDASRRGITGAPTDVRRSHGHAHSYGHRRWPRQCPAPISACQETVVRSRPESVLVMRRRPAMNRSQRSRNSNCITTGSTG